MRTSYRLTIKLPDKQKQYLLELPEIFSAYRAYINGTLVQVMGEPNPDNYFPETGSHKPVRFMASGSIDILISVSDFSHLYSGMAYPPAFGEPDTVAGMLSARLILRSIFLAFAFAIGIIALLISMTGGKNRILLLLSLLCLFFIRRVQNSKNAVTERDFSTRKNKKSLQKY